MLKLLQTELTGSGSLLHPPTDTHTHTHTHTQNKPMLKVVMPTQLSLPSGALAHLCTTQVNFSNDPGPPGNRTGTPRGLYYVTQVQAPELSS